MKKNIKKVWNIKILFLSLYQQKETTSINNLKRKYYGRN